MERSHASRPQSPTPATNPAATTQIGTVIATADPAIFQVTVDATATAWWRDRPVRLRLRREENQPEVGP